MLDLHENELVSKTHFHMKGCTPWTRFETEVKGTRKWPMCSMENHLFINNTFEFKYKYCLQSFLILSGSILYLTVLFL